MWDFGNIKGARQRAQHLCVPQDWCDLVRTAWRNNPFNVIPMENLSLKCLQQVIVNRKVNTQKLSVNWLNIRWFKLRKGEPLHYHYRHSHNTLDPWKMVDLSKNTKGHPVDIGQVQMEVLYAGPRVINNKLDDLMSLFSFVPPVYHDLYRALVGGGSEFEEDGLLDHDDGVSFHVFFSDYEARLLYCTKNFDGVTFISFSHGFAIVCVFAMLMLLY